MQAHHRNGKQRKLLNSPSGAITGEPSTIDYFRTAAVSDNRIPAVLLQHFEGGVVRDRNFLSPDRISGCVGGINQHRNAYQGFLIIAQDVRCQKEVLYINRAGTTQSEVAVRGSPDRTTPRIMLDTILRASPTAQKATIVFRAPSLKTTGCASSVPYRREAS